MRNVACLRFLAGLPLLAMSFAHAADFALHNGDRVVFYGDSITDNAPYTKFTETYVRTHFPKLNVRFFNAGVGGDRVTGGWMGPIDQRLTRDLFSRQPTVITIMLGMNDASYRGFDQGIFDTYRKGYEHILDRIKAEAPTARVWLIQPSPFDDVTRPAAQPEPYNDVLRQYSAYVGSLAKARGLQVVDFNTPMVNALKKALVANQKAAPQIIPDRVHPAAAGHLLMAAELVHAWGAPASAASVEISTGSQSAIAALGTRIKDFSAGPDVTWTELDNALPFPMDTGDELTNLILTSSPLAEDFGTHRLTVKNLPVGNYALTIDEKPVANLTQAQLQEGVDLNAFKTPMKDQATALGDRVNSRANLRYQIWRAAEFELSAADRIQGPKALTAMSKFDDELLQTSMAEAKSKPHRFMLKKI